MPNTKSHRVEKIPTERLADETLSVIEEMLNIIVSRTQMGNPEKEFIYTGGELKYFGVGQQLKVSKLADTLYGTLKDVIVFVISEMAKESDVDIKFQMPKYTSFVGSIVKYVAIDVIAHNDTYRDYLDTLSRAQGKYPFDSSDAIFINIYRDTVLALNDRGFLFADDPELLSIQHESKDLNDLDASVGQTNPLNAINTEDILRTFQTNFSSIQQKPDDLSDDGNDIFSSLEEGRSSSRNRVILPYLRRLFETKKSVNVTRRRVSQVAGVVEPSDEVKRAFNEKYQEVFASCQQMQSSTEMIRAHSTITALSYLREHFSKDEVDIMEQYLNSERASMVKFRRRYVKVQSGKRVHFAEGMNDEFAMSLTPESLQSKNYISELWIVCWRVSTRLLRYIA